MSQIVHRFSKFLLQRYIGDRIHCTRYSIPIVIRMTSTTTNEAVIDSPIEAKSQDSTANKVLVRFQEGSDSMVISFRLILNGKSRFCNLTRNPDEPLVSAIERIKLNMLKLNKNAKGTKKTKNKSFEPSEIPIELVQDGKIIDPTKTTNRAAWIDGTLLRLGEQEFIVTKNEPQVIKLRLPAPILKGFVILPLIELCNCELSSCKIEWFRHVSAKERNEMLECNDPLLAKVEHEDKQYWLKVGDGLSYRPTEEDVAHLLKCVCEPQNLNNREGQKMSVCSSQPVEIGPKGCPFEKRHHYTTKRFESIENKIRVLTYNILADLYADSDYSRSVLFAHCPPYALEIEYRRQLLLKEIEGYNSDLICLQEVDRKEYQNIYKPYFSLVTGHDGIFHTKGSQVPEGVATFFRKDRFELIDSHRTVLNKLIDPSALAAVFEAVEGDADVRAKTLVDNEAKKCHITVQEQPYPHPFLDHLDSSETKALLSQFESLRKVISHNPALFKRFVARHTVLQTSLLKVKHKPSTFFIVANTHLYFAPDADHIRLLQGCVCVRYLEYIEEYYTNMIIDKNLGEGKPKLSMIFCGDMNSSPDCGLYSLLQQGSVGEDLKDWHSNQEEKVDNFSFSTKLRFTTAYNDIAYTNYTPGFNGCLDYIYYDRTGFELDRTIPLPDHEDVIAYDGIPSDVFPSDHIALVADLRFE